MKQIKALFSILLILLFWSCQEPIKKGTSNNLKAEFIQKRKKNSKLANVVSDSFPNLLFTKNAPFDSIIDHFGYGVTGAQSILEGDDWALYPTVKNYPTYGITYLIPELEGNINKEEFNFVYGLEFDSTTDLQLKCGIKPGRSSKLEVENCFGLPDSVSHLNTFPSFNDVKSKYDNFYDLNYGVISFRYSINSDTIESILIEYKN